jgi:hypothetical protein
MGQTDVSTALSTGIGVLTGNKSSAAAVPSELDSRSFVELETLLAKFVSYRTLSSDDSTREECWRCAKFLGNILETTCGASVLWLLIDCTTNRLETNCGPRNDSTLQPYYTLKLKPIVWRIL